MALTDPVRQEGKFDVLYVSATDPASGTGTNPEQQASNYTRVGLLDGLSNSLSNDTNSTIDRDSKTHQDVVASVQSSEVTITANVLKEASGTTGIDDGHVLVRDAAYNQDDLFWLIQGEDGSGTPVTDLEGVYGKSLVTDYEVTRDAGDFKQFDSTFTNKEQPTTFTQS